MTNRRPPALHRDFRKGSCELRNLWGFSYPLHTKTRRKARPCGEKNNHDDERILKLPRRGASKSTELFTPVKIAFVPLQQPLSRGPHPTLLYYAHDGVVLVVKWVCQRHRSLSLRFHGVNKVAFVITLEKKIWGKVQWKSWKNLKPQKIRKFKMDAKWFTQRSEAKKI